MSDFIPSSPAGRADVKVFDTQVAEPEAARASRYAEYPAWCAALQDACPPVRPRSISGADTIAFLESLGGQFVLVAGASAPGASPGKRPLGRAWQERPQTGAQARAHLAHGGNIGLLTGRAGLCLIDVDAGLGRTLEVIPDLARVTYFYRKNADDRAKFLVRLEEGVPNKDFKGQDAEIEFLAAGSQGVVAGTHHTGEQILCRFGIEKLPSLTWPALADALAQAAGTPLRPATARPKRMPTQAAIPRVRESVIDAFNRTKRICDILDELGYTVSDGKFTRPGKNPRDGISGTIDVAKNQAYTFSSNDPAYRADDLSPRGAGCTLKPFDLLCSVQFAGDARAAVRWLCGAAR